MTGSAEWRFDEQSWMIHAQGIGVIYSDSEDQDKLNGVFADSLFIPSVGVTAVLGDSGSGKSTLLGLLTAIRKNNLPADPDQKLLYRDQKGICTSILDNADSLDQGEFGFVFQDAQLIKTVSVTKNCKVGSIKANSENERSRSLSDYIESFGLGGKENSLAEFLSGGQAQRVAVIRALLVNPNLLVCDEPTSSLDENTAKQVMAEISNWAQSSNRAVIWVTHDKVLAAEYADHALGVCNGQLIKGDDNFPKSLKGLSSKERTEVINRLNGQAANEIPALTLGRIKEITSEITENDSINNLDVLNVQLKQKSFATSMKSKLITLCFLLSCGVSSVLAPYYKVDKENTKKTKLRAFGLSFFGNSLTWVILLGMVVSLCLSTAYSFSKSYFNKSLEAPEVSHFVIRTKGGSGRNLDNRTRASIKKTLKSVVGGVSGSTPQLYGRRAELLTDVWLPQEHNGCTQKSDMQTVLSGLAIRVFDIDEPLFSNLKVSRFPVAGDFGQVLSSESGVESVITPTLLSLFGQSKIEHLCIDIHGPEKIKVSGVTDVLPGGGSQHFQIGLTEKKYRSVITKKRPMTLVDDEGRFRIPNYSEVALYFNHEVAPKIICSFDQKIDGCTDIQLSNKVSQQLSGFKLNHDVMKQINGLLKTSSVAGAALLFLGGIFALVIALSTGLAISAFVKENEKSIAIMRVHKFKFSDVLFLLFSQTIFLALSAFVMFALSMAVWEILFVDRLAEILSVSGSWLSATGSDFGISILSLHVLVLTVIALVLGNWWKKNKYLGSALQAL